MVDEMAALQAELALAQRRLARAEAARTQAEALLEVKSRVLAEANAELKDHREQLSSQLSQRTRQLLDAQRVAGFGTMIWDLQARTGEMSPHAQTLLGVGGALAMGSIHPLLRQVEPGDRIALLRWARGVRELANGACPSPDVPDCPLGAVPESSTAHAADCARCEAQLQQDRGLELQLLPEGAGGRAAILRLMARLEHDAALGRPLVFLTLQDVTREVEAAREAATLRAAEQRRLAELEVLTAELQKARDVAEAANVAKTRFLAMMSHDIRTPLNGVIGMLSLLDETGLGAAQRDTLAVVKGSSDQLRMLLDDIIDLERAQSGKLSLNPAPIDVTAFINGWTHFWAKVAADKGLELVLERQAFGWPGPRLGWVMADRFRLRQIIDNLLSNAIKFTSEGRVTVRIGPVAEGRTRLEVIDSGIGIPAHRRHELFQDFGQLYMAGAEQGGSGLGLAICRRLVELQGGEIGMEDAPGGRGSKFWVEIPLHEIPAPSLPQAVQARTLHCEGSRRPRILVAEDVETNRLVARGMLARLGCDVKMVVNGQEAVTTAAEGGFDVVLMDMAMPVMDGPTATAHIRQLPGAAGQVPILALTAYSRPEELAPMLEAGAQGSINKPVTLETLYTQLAATLAGTN